MNIGELNSVAMNGAGTSEAPPPTLGFYGRTARNNSGAAIAGAEVIVTDSAGQPVEIFDGNVNDSPSVISQPLLTDSNGAFRFYAPFGVYTVTVTNDGDTATLPDQAIGPDREYTDSITSRSVPAPVGSMARFPANIDAPENWVLAGSVLNAVDYPTLFGQVGKAQLPRPPENKTMLIGPDSASSNLGFTPELNAAPYFRGNHLIVPSADQSADNGKVLGRYEVDQSGHSVRVAPYVDPVFVNSSQFTAYAGGIIDKKYSHGDGRWLAYLANFSPYVRYLYYPPATTGGYIQKSASIGGNVASGFLDTAMERIYYRSKGDVGVLATLTTAPNQTGGELHLGRVQQNFTFGNILHQAGDSFTLLSDRTRDVYPRILPNGDIAAFAVQETRMNVCILKTNNTTVNINTGDEFDTNSDVPVDFDGRYFVGTHATSKTTVAALWELKQDSEGAYVLEKVDEVVLVAERSQFRSADSSRYNAMSPDGKRCRIVLNYEEITDTQHSVYEFEIVNGKLIAIEPRPIPEGAATEQDSLDAIAFGDVLVPVEVRTAGGVAFASAAKFTPLASGTFRAPDAGDPPGYLLTYVKAK